jgi:hypothetical protein
MFTLSFWKNALEATLVAGLAAFAASLSITTTPSLKDLEAAAIAGGMGALYAFIKQLGGVQAMASVLKVDGRHVKSSL